MQSPVLLHGMADKYPVSYADNESIDSKCMLISADDFNKLALKNSRNNWQQKLAHFIQDIFAKNVPVFTSVDCLNVVLYLSLSKCLDRRRNN